MFSFELYCNKKKAMPNLLGILQKRYPEIPTTVTLTTAKSIQFYFDLSKDGGNLFKIMSIFNFNDFNTANDRVFKGYGEWIHVHFKVLDSRTFNIIYKDRCFGLTINMRTGEVENCDGKTMKLGKVQPFSSSYHTKLAQFKELDLTDPKEPYFICGMTLRLFHNT